MDGTTGGIWQASYAMREYHQPAMLYGTETVPVNSSNVKKLESDKNEDVQMGKRPHTKRPCEKR